MKKNFLALGTCAFALALGLVACGEDSDSNSGTNGVKGEVIALADGSGEKVCDEKLEGWVAEAVGKDFRRCQNGEWTKITANEASAEDEIIGGVTVLRSSSSTIDVSSSSTKDPELVETLSSSALTTSSSSAPTENLGSFSSVKDPEQVDGSSSSSVVSGPSSETILSSSSSVTLSDSEGSSSSVTSSSSVVSSSSVESSSSVASSSSVKSSSSKANWTYLNSNIDYGTMTDARDGQVYKTVKIGTQTWMAENLNYAYKGVGYNVFSYTSDSTSWCYGNLDFYCSKYGRFYTWSAVMDSAAKFSENAGTRCGDGKTCTPKNLHRGICPEGWHVPRLAEYRTLFSNIGTSSTTGVSLKSTSGWLNGRNGIDKYGFSVLPAGTRQTNGTSGNEGVLTYLWTTSEYVSSSTACVYVFTSDEATLLDGGCSKRNGVSLRCLKD